MAAPDGEAAGRAGLRDRAVAVAGKPCRLGARRAHRRQPLQGLGPGRERQHLVEHRPGILAAPRLHAAQRRQRRDAADRRHVGPRQQALGDLGRLAPQALVEPRHGEPGGHVVVGRIEVALARVGHALGEMPLGIGEAEDLAVGHADVGVADADQRIEPGRRRRARCCAGDGRGRSRRRSPAAPCRSRSPRRRRWCCRRTRSASAIAWRPSAIAARHVAVEHPSCAPGCDRRWRAGASAARLPAPRWRGRQVSSAAAVRPAAHQRPGELGEVLALLHPVAGLDAAARSPARRARSASARSSTMAHSSA